MIHLAIFIIGAIFGFILAIALMMLVMDKFVPNDEKDYMTQDERKEHMSICEKCKQSFSWNEKDALIKYKYGTKFIVHCPHCDKLTKVYIEEE